MGARQALTAAATDRKAAALLSPAAVDRTYALLAGWLMAGVYLDAWAHGLGLPDSFWTLWHGVLYSGLAACGAFLLAAKIAERQTEDRILARGYDLSLIGIAVGALGGIADAYWHTIFGIELNIDAAVSPSHLVIVVGIFLIVSGPARAAWARGRLDFPGALSLLYTLSIITVILSYAMPFAYLAGVNPGPRTFEVSQLAQVRDIFAFAAYGALVAGAVFALTRATTPAWAFPIVLGGNALAMTLQSQGRLGDHLLLLAILAIAWSTFAFVFAALVRPSRSFPRVLELFGVVLVVALYLGYVGAVNVIGAWWTPTFSFGLIAIGGLTAALVGTTLISGRERS